MLRRIGFPAVLALVACASPERLRTPPMPEQAAAGERAPADAEPPETAPPPETSPPSPHVSGPVPHVRQVFARLHPAGTRAEACPSRCVVLAEPTRTAGAPATVLVAWMNRGRFPQKVVALLVRGADGWVAFELGRLDPEGALDDLPRADRVHHALTTNASPPVVRLHLELLTPDHVVLPGSGVRDVACEVPASGAVRCEEALTVDEER